MDVFGRLKQVDELNWDQSVYATTTYTYNARDQLTQSNQLGQLRTFEYDGFGRLWKRTTPEQGLTTLTYNMDDTVYHDRLRVKKVESATTTYYLRSSVLGRQVISEINASGVFQRGYVYLGGQMLAIQQSNAVSWVHQDPVTKSQRVTNSAGAVTSTIDLDPWGGETARSSNLRRIARDSTSAVVSGSLVKNVVMIHKFKLEDSLVRVQKWSQMMTDESYDEARR
jgi:YD repeat-containing protein